MLDQHTMLVREDRINWLHLTYVGVEEGCWVAQGRQIGGESCIKVLFRNKLSQTCSFLIIMTSPDLLSLSLGHLGQQVDAGLGVHSGRQEQCEHVLNKLHHQHDPWPWASCLGSNLSCLLRWIVWLATYQTGNECALHLVLPFGMQLWCGIYQC